MSLQNMYFRRMVKKYLIAILVVTCIGGISVFSSCKGCKKETPAATPIDTTATVSTPVDMITTPHGDSALIPVFVQILDEAFAASKAKDNAKLASLLMYHGPDEKRHNLDVHALKDKYEIGIVKTTAEVFNKWNANVESREYPRVFSMPLPDGTSIEMLEVMFIGPKKVDRKFFGFEQINGSYKISNITSRME